MVPGHGLATQRDLRRTGPSTFRAPVTADVFVGTTRRWEAGAPR
jgi:hypothetical protein